MAEKDMRIALLLDFYGELLPEGKREMMWLYYNEDLSLSEIAEQVGITRQGVRDAVSHAGETLREWEDKLHIAERFLEQKNEVSAVTALAEKLRDRCREKNDPELTALAEAVICEISELCF